MGNNSLVNEYVDLMTSPLNAKSPQPETFNFLNPEFIINSTIVYSLRSTQGIAEVDTRLVTFSNIAEVQNLTIQDEGNPNPDYVMIGDHRSAQSLVVGIDPNHVANNPLTQKGFLQPQNMDAAVIGDSVANTIFEDPYQQNIDIFSNVSNNSLTLPVTSVAVDILNHGNVVYIPVTALQKLNSIDGFNLILVKIQKSNAVTEISQLAKQYNLTVIDLDNARQQSLSNIDHIWLSILPFPMLSIVTATIGLLNCMSVSMSSHITDFGILRAIGAKPNYVTKAVFLESLFFILVTAPIGIAIGMIFNFLILIPTPVLATPILVASLGGEVLALIGMCGLTTLMMIKKRKQLPMELLHEPV